MGGRKRHQQRIIIRHDLHQHRTRTKRRRQVLLLVLAAMALGCSVMRHALPEHFGMFSGTALVDYIFTAAAGVLGVALME